MSFNHRRQSRDACLRRRLLDMTAGRRLWMSPGSAAQFSPEDADRLQVSETFLNEAGPGDYQLRASRSGRVRLTLTAPGAFLAWPGQLVQVDLPDFGANGLYRVAQSEAACGQEGLTTTLVLGETDAMI